MSRRALTEIHGRALLCGRRPSDSFIAMAAARVATASQASSTMRRSMTTMMTTTATAAVAAVPAASTIKVSKVHSVARCARFPSKSRGIWRASWAPRSAAKSSSQRSNCQSNRAIGEMGAEFGGAMPKKEIGVSRLTSEIPDADGRGVIVAIFDSGVDPGAAGLATTSDGKPKVIDVVDCSGSDDIVSVATRKPENGLLQLASGKSASVNPEWPVPESEEYHVGYKHAFEVFTSTLKRRIKGERQKRSSILQREATASALSNLETARKELEKASNDVSKKTAVDEGEARLNLLTTLEQKIPDMGPVVDVVWWKQEDKWWIAVDTSDLEGGTPLSTARAVQPFSVAQEFITLSKEDVCNVACHVYDDGKIASLVTDCSPHGTHVSGITAAHFENDPIMDGIAPGAQIVSCKIGDARLDGMETVQGLTRALVVAVQHRCDVINMSYGEPAALPNHGKWQNFADEVVYKHRVMFISSAGNAGPALSTVGAPGSTSNSIMGIGAWVSAAMASDAHSYLEADNIPEEGMQYTWSSRGPCVDGHFGVSVSAPGAAIAPVPNWTLSKSQLMNGTSMASPSACGAAAVLLGRCKAMLNDQTKKIANVPVIVRKAMENSAKPNSPYDPLTRGYGIVQMPEALEILKKTLEGEGLPDARFDVTVTYSGGHAMVPSNTPMRGVYLRDNHLCNTRVEAQVEVGVNFHEDQDNMEDKVAFEERLQLSSSEPWVSCPQSLLLPACGRRFAIEVDPRKLQSGVHVAEVVATQAGPQSNGVGPVFRVPVTVVKGELPNVDLYTAKYDNLRFAPGEMVRKFISVPLGATWAELELKADGFAATKDENDTDSSKQIYFLHCLQLGPQRRYRELEHDYVPRLSRDHSSKYNFVVQEDSILEVTLARFWSTAGPSQRVSIDVSFHGLNVSSSEINLVGSRAPARMEIQSKLNRTERFEPRASLDCLRLLARPNAAGKITPLGKRDLLPENKQTHAMILSYSISLVEPAKITAHLSGFGSHIYDGQIDCPQIQICDSNKRLVKYTEAYAEAVKLEKGDYTIRCQLRHDKVAVLESMKTLVLEIDQHLEKAIDLDVYPSQQDAVMLEHASNKPLKDKVLIHGEKLAVFIAPPKEEQLSNKELSKITVGKVKGPSGGVLHGSFKYTRSHSAAAANITFPVGPAAPEEKKEEIKADETEGLSAAEKAKKALDDAVRDAKQKAISELAANSVEEVEILNQQAKVALESYPSHLPMMQMYMNKLKEWAEKDKDLDKSPVEARWTAVTEAADAIIDSIDQQELARTLGVRNDLEDKSAMKTRKDADQQKDTLLNALKAKFTCGEKLKKPDLVELCFTEMKKWEDMNTPKNGRIRCIRETSRGNYGLAYKALVEYMEDAGSPKKEDYEMQAHLLEQLGFSWIKSRIDSVILNRFPKDFPVF